MKSTRIIVSAEKADEIMSGAHFIKLLRTSDLNFKEGDILHLKANLPNGHYHPVTHYEYLITDIEPVDDYYINVYFEPQEIK